MDKLATVMLAFLFMIGLSFLFSLPVMWLWNFLMPKIFGLTTLTWVESWCLMLLTNFLANSSFRYSKD